MGFGSIHTIFSYKSEQPKPTVQIQSLGGIGLIMATFKTQKQTNSALILRKHKHFEWLLKDGDPSDSVTAVTI